MLLLFGLSPRGSCYGHPRLWHDTCTLHHDAFRIVYSARGFPFVRCRFLLVFNRRLMMVLAFSVQKMRRKGVVLVRRKGMRVVVALPFASNALSETVWETLQIVGGGA